MIDIIYCIKCERLRNTLMAQLPFIRSKAKEKAIEENKTYIIYFDSEDSKLRYKENDHKTENIVEYISKHP